MMNSIREYTGRYGALSFFLAFAIGILLFRVSEAYLAPLMTEYRDTRNPVVAMDGDIVKRGVGFVDIHVYGEKLRKCRYMQTQAFARVDGQLKDMETKRIDTPETGATKPLGRFDIGVWHVSPLPPNTTHAVMYVQHDCDGRVVVTKIADEAIQ